VGEGKLIQGFGGGNMKERAYFEELVVNGGK
jgi:hypothetical protein